MLNIKTLSLILLLVAFGLTSLPAQVNPTTANRDVTAEDYERMIENLFKVQFRSFVIEKLGLNEEQTTRFTPIYLEYMEAKANLADKRMRLVESYQEEMKEDDSTEDEKEETADFIENYWEVDIDAMELRKDYFDRLEDAISYRNAMQFFLMEESIDRMFVRADLTKLVPNAKLLQMPKNQSDRMAGQDKQMNNNRMPINRSDDTQMNNQRQTTTQPRTTAPSGATADYLHIDGTVDLSHSHTRDGLYKLVEAAEAIASAKNITVNNWASTKQNILQKADYITKNWRSLDHADRTKEAFMSLNDVYSDIHQKGNFTGVDNYLNNMKDATGSIDVDVWFTRQPQHFKRYFENAEMLVNEMARQANLSNTGTMSSRSN